MTTKTDQQEATKALRSILNPGDTLHTILRNVSRSGMSRQIGVIGPNMRDLTWLISRACDYRMNARNDGLKVGGCGSDMGFEVVYNLGRYLFPDGFKVDGKGRNGDTSGWDNDGGYALKHRWL